MHNTTNATGSPALPAWITVGGTSAATPLVAAVEALSSAAARSLGAAAFYESPASLFDVTSGSNGSCGGTYLCTAGPGYDGPTGVGTPYGAFPSSAPAPAVTSIAPDQSPVAGGLTVTITGSGFLGATSVDFGSHPATGFTFETPTRIRATVPAGTGQVCVSVATPEGTSAEGPGCQFTYYAPLTVTTTGLSEGVIGTPYSQPLEAEGGQPPYKWALFTGSLPAGLELASPGIIAGTPTAAGTSSFTAEVTDSAGATATAKLSITVSSTLRAGHPELFVNGRKVAGAAQPSAEILSGNIELSSPSIPEGELECASIDLGSGWNAGTPPRARGLVFAWTAGGHVATAAHGELGPACRAGGGSAFLTDELPVEPVSAAEARHGVLTVPWTLETTCGEREGEAVPVVRIGIPADAGEAAASCRSEATEDASAQSEVANAEGCYASDPAPRGCVGLAVIAPSLGLELEYGGTLRARVLNGVGNGLGRSRWVLQGPAAGELRCEAPAGCQSAKVLGELKVQGYEAVQLVQLK